MLIDCRHVHLIKRHLANEDQSQLLGEELTVTCHDPKGHDIINRYICLTLWEHAHTQIM